MTDEQWERVPLDLKKKIMDQMMILMGMATGAAAAIKELEKEKPR